MDLNINLKLNQLQGKQSFDNNSKATEAQETTQNTAKGMNLNNLVEGLKNGSISVKDSLKYLQETGLLKNVVKQEDKSVAEAKTPDKTITVITNDSNVKASESVEEAQATANTNDVEATNNGPKTQLDDDDKQKINNALKSLGMNKWGNNETQTREILNNCKETIREILSNTTLPMENFDQIYPDIVNALLYYDIGIYVYYNDVYTINSLTNKSIDVLNNAIKFYPYVESSGASLEKVLCAQQITTENKTYFQGIETVHTGYSKEFQAYTLLTVAGLKDMLCEKYGDEQGEVLFKVVASKVCCNNDNYMPSGMTFDYDHVTNGRYISSNHKIIVEQDLAVDLRDKGKESFVVIEDKLMFDFLSVLENVTSREPLTLTKKELEEVARCIPENNITMNQQQYQVTNEDNGGLFGYAPTLSGDFEFIDEIGLPSNEKLRQNTAHEFVYENNFGPEHEFVLHECVPAIIDQFNNMMSIMELCPEFKNNYESINHKLYTTLTELNNFINSLAARIDDPNNNTLTEADYNKLAEFGVIQLECFIDNDKIFWTSSNSAYIQTLDHDYTQDEQVVSASARFTVNLGMLLDKVFPQSISSQFTGLNTEFTKDVIDVRTNLDSLDLKMKYEDKEVVNYDSINQLSAMDVTLIEAAFADYTPIHTGYVPYTQDVNKTHNFHKNEQLKAKIIAAISDALSDTILADHDMEALYNQCINELFSSSLGYGVVYQDLNGMAGFNIRPCDKTELASKLSKLLNNKIAEAYGATITKEYYKFGETNTEDRYYYERIVSKETIVYPDGTEVIDEFDGYGNVVKGTVKRTDGSSRVTEYNMYPSNKKTETTISAGGTKTITKYENGEVVYSTTYPNIISDKFNKDIFAKDIDINVLTKDMVVTAKNTKEAPEAGVIKKVASNNTENGIKIELSAEDVASLKELMTSFNGCSSDDIQVVKDAILNQLESDTFKGAVLQMLSNTALPNGTEEEVYDNCVNRLLSGNELVVTTFAGGRVSYYSVCEKDRIVDKLVNALNEVIRAHASDIPQRVEESVDADGITTVKVYEYGRLRTENITYPNGKVIVRQYADAETVDTGIIQYTDRTIAVEYSASGQEIRRTTTYNDGTVTVEEREGSTYLAEETITYPDNSVIYKEFYATGKVKLEQTTNDAGTTTKEYTYYRTPHENQVSTQTITYPDGTVTVEKFSNKGIKWEETINSSDGMVTYRQYLPETGALNYETIKYPDGTNVSTVYDANGNLSSITTTYPDETVEAHTFNPDKIWITKPDGSKVITEYYSYPDKIKHEEIKDADGTKTVRDYDSNGNLTHERVESNGKIVKETIVSNTETVINEYDANGKIAKKTINFYGGNYEIREYNNGKLVNRTYSDSGNNIYTEEYDDNGNLTKKTVKHPDGSTVTTEFYAGTNTKKTETTLDSDNNGQRVYYDKNGKVNKTVKIVNGKEIEEQHNDKDKGTTLKDLLNDKIKKPLNFDFDKTIVNQKIDFGRTLDRHNFNK